MFLFFHPTHCLSHVYCPVLVFDLVTICGDGDESLETHQVSPLDPGALSTFVSLINNREALDHSDCSSPSESVVLMNVDNFCPASHTLGCLFDDCDVVEASLESKKNLQLLLCPHETLPQTNCLH